MLRLAVAASANASTSRQLISLAQRAAAAPARSGIATAPQSRPFFASPASSIRASRMAAAAFGNVDVQGAAELVQSGAYTYADVRTPEEFAGGHAPGAVNVPVFLKQAGQMVPNPDFVAQFTKAFPDKNAQLVVGCLSGKRSMAACDILSNNGYSNLSNVEGGYQAWTGAGLPVEA